MSYTITLTDGAIYAVVADGTVNTSSSMTLVGKNWAGYGQFLGDNFIRLLENGANTTAPGAPLTGQLWWNKTAGTMQVYNGTGFKTLGGATSASSAPSNNTIGDLWYDTVNQQLNVWTGSAWIVVGPAYTPGTGTTGAIVATIVDNTATSHFVIELYSNNTIVGIISKDQAFTPGSAVAGGWGTQIVNPGITLATGVANNAVWGNVTGTNLAASGTVSATGTITGGNLVTGGTLNVTGAVTINTGGAATGIINGAGNAIGNIGSSGSYFNQIFAQATTALYADVAERFAADDVYSPGTVVELGGSAEITKVKTDGSNAVFGVISTRPAFTMNGGAGENDTHPPVAMTGRVPVCVTGAVNKGDRLISAGDGIARAAGPEEATAFNVIGRALADKLDIGLGVVEAIVTIK
jgi:hypothetical protein